MTCVGLMMKKGFDDIFAEYLARMKDADLQDNRNENQAELTEYELQKRIQLNYLHN